MKTKVIRDEIAEAAGLLRKGGLVAVPTETVYGLAGNGLDPAAIAQIYEIKGRPAVKPISLMVSGWDAVDGLCERVPGGAAALAEAFWPGPLTIVLPAREEIPLLLRAGGNSVGLRCPRQEQTLALLRSLEFPLAVPSANPSGEKSPRSAGEVLAWFDGKIDAIVDGGICELGTASTVLDMTETPYRVLRKGCVSEDEIADTLVQAMQIVGITGGSGCGKTSALDVLREYGALVIDADAVYHELLRDNVELLEELHTAFPTAFCEGRLERPLLAGIVFTDPQALRELNRISHRHVGIEIRRRLREHAMKGGCYAAIDAIELFDGGAAAYCDWTLAVTAPEEARLERIMARDGISREAALARIRAQHSEEYFTERCDETVRNDGEVRDFQMKITTILEERKWTKRTEK